MYQIKFEEEKQNIVKTTSNISLVCFDCNQAFYTSYFTRVLNRKPDCENYFLCRHCKKVRNAKRKKEEQLLKAVDKTSPEYKQMMSDSRKQSCRVYNEKVQQCKESQSVLQDISNESINRHAFDMIKYICPTCKKEKITTKKVLLKNKICKDCRGLDTVELKTGFRGNLKNPVNMEKLNKSFEEKGYHRPFELKSVQDKVTNTFNERYGFRKAGWNNKELIFKKYGVDNVSYLPWVQDKIMKSLSDRCKDYYNRDLDNTFDFSKMNSLEKAFYDKIKVFGEFSFANREVLRTSEIDFFNKVLNEGYEIGAEYWHSVENKGVNYHYNKHIKGLKLNVPIFQFFANDLKNNTLESYIRYTEVSVENIEAGDFESEFNFFNNSFYKVDFLKYEKISDSLGGRYIKGANNDFSMIVPTNNKGSLRKIIKLFSESERILVDNRLCPLGKLEDKIVNITIQNNTQDAGYVIIGL